MGSTLKGLGKPLMESITFVYLFTTIMNIFSSLLFMMFFWVYKIQNINGKHSFVWCESFFVGT